MKPTSIVFAAFYAIVAGLILVVGFVYPDLKPWSHWSAGVVVFHALLGVAIGMANVAQAARIIASSWLTISNLAALGLLFGYFRTQEGGWLLGLAALIGVTLLILLGLILMVKPNSVQGR